MVGSAPEYDLKSLIDAHGTITIRLQRDFTRYTDIGKNG